MNRTGDMVKLRAYKESPEYSVESVRLTAFAESAAVDRKITRREVEGNMVKGLYGNRRPSFFAFCIFATLTRAQDAVLGKAWRARKKSASRSCMGVREEGTEISSVPNSVIDGLVPTPQLRRWLRTRDGSLGFDMRAKQNLSFQHHHQHLELSPWNVWFRSQCERNETSRRSAGY